VDGVNTWSFAIDSTEFIPDSYEVIVTPATVPTENIGRVEPFGRVSLTVLEATLDLLTPLPPDDKPCKSITIDALPGKLTNKTYTVTGTTGLSPGTELLFQVLPMEYLLAMSPGSEKFSGTMSGATGRAAVTRGTGGRNTWSADLDLSMLPPKEYSLNVSNDRIDPRTYATIYGDRYCSERFVVER
jgi:hypothetical protein